MFYNKWAIAAVAATAVLFILVMAVPSSPPKEAVVARQNTEVVGADDISRILGDYSSRYLGVDLSKVDMTGPIVAALLGIGIIIGTDFAVRRRTNSVIKRRFPQDKDNR